MNVGALQLKGQTFSEDWWQAIPAQVPEGAYAPKRGGILKYRYANDAPHLDPTVQAAFLPAGVFNLVYNKLLQVKIGRNGRYDAIELDPQRGLANKYETPDNGKTYIFTMKPGVKWQNLDPVNGRAFSAEDVRWTYDHYMSTTGSVETGFFTDVDKLESPDANTLKITLKEPNADFLASLASPYIPILAKEIAARDGDFRKTAVGTGPFQIKDWQRDSQLTLERNPTYSVNKGPNGEQLPYLDQVQIVVIPDNAAAQAAFRTGNLRQSYGTGLENIDAYPEFFKQHPEIFAQRIITRGSASFMFMHLDQAPFNDVRVRRALSMAYNYDQIVDTLAPKNGAHVVDWMYWYFMGLNKPRTSKEAGKYFAFDPQQAKQMMTAAGHPNGFDVNVVTYGTTFTPNVQLVQQFWKQTLGVNINIKTIDYTALLAQLVGKNWDGIQASSVNLGFSLDELTRQHVYSKSARNYIGLNDPMLDDLALKQKLEFDAAKRQQYAKQIADIYFDNVYAFWSPASAYSFELWYPNLRNYRYFGPWIAYQYKADELEEVWLDS
jgi:peptide/nickel transport system substrate-binding protein